MPARPVSILFDLDGTLIDTIELIMQSMEFAFSDFAGARPTRAEWLEGLGIPLRTQLAQRARTPDELDWLIARYRIFQGEHHDRMTVAYPGVSSVLTELTAAGHSMGIVTSKFYAGAKRALEHLHFASYFGTIVGGDSIANAKPHPEPVLRALADLDAAADRTLFVGDSPHDITAGNAAGVATAGALWGPFNADQIARARPTHWLRKISDLPALVRTL